MDVKQRLKKKKKKKKRKRAGATLDTKVSRVLAAVASGGSSIVSDT